MIKRFVDRSRVESYQRCARARYLGYELNGIGISGTKTSLPLCVGGSVHEGLAHLLREGQHLVTLHSPTYSVEEISKASDSWIRIEHEAVGIALVDFAQYKSALELDTTEQAAQGVRQEIPDNVMREQLAASLGLSVDDAGLGPLMQNAQQGARAFDEYLWQEQCALVEGIVRAYARRRLKPLLEQYEVLEVEREGEWLLSEWFTPADVHQPIDNRAELWFMSRPDALLRDRTDNNLYLLSFKTAASWDVRKEKDAQHDMQGLSEGVEVERRLQRYWSNIHEGVLITQAEMDEIDRHKDQTHPFTYLKTLSAPPRILGIRYEFLLKGERWKDKELSQRVGFDARSQRSHLIRAYKCHSVPRGAQAFGHGDLCWTWDYLKDDGTESHLAWQNWRSIPVWEEMSVKEWIDRLDASEESMSAYDSTTGMEPRSLGWKSEAQRLGFTTKHPLDSIFLPPIVIYRSDDSLRDLIEEMEAQEREVAEGIALIEAAQDEGERRSLLNQRFRRTLKACEYPGTCQFVPICHGPEEMRHDPIASGRYRERTPNHAQEIPQKIATGAK